MDMMTIRKMVMVQMAQSGAQFVKGTFTVPDSGSGFRLDFGKSFNKYIFIVEATEESKITIINSGINGDKAYAFIGIMPRFSIDNINGSFNGTYSRINPATSSSSSQAATNIVPYESYISFAVNSLADGMSVLFRGLTYNYYIVEIK